MDWSSVFYGWMVEHKDGLLVLAAVASPFISAFAVVTGPFVQRKIAEQNNRLNREQFSYQRKQTQAILQGNYNQKWADRFSEKAAEFIVNSGKIQRIQSSKTSATDRSSQYRDKLQELRDKNKILQVELFIVLEKDDLSNEFTEAINEIVNLEEHDVKLLMPLINRASEAARQIVSNRLSEAWRILQ